MRSAGCRSPVFIPLPFSSGPNTPRVNIPCGHFIETSTSPMADGLHRAILGSSDTGDNGSVKWGMIHQSEGCMIYTEAS